MPAQPSLLISVPAESGNQLNPQWYLLEEPSINEEARNKQEPDDDDPVATVDIFPPKFDEPVPFGHIGIEGFGDPYNGQKPPIDFLELSMMPGSSLEKAKEMIERGDGSKLQFQVPRSYPNPRDKWLQDIVIPPEGNNTLKWYQLAETQRRNAMMPELARKLQAKPNDKKLKVSEASNPNPNNKKAQFFSKHMFRLNSDQDEEKKFVNWTTCSEFGAGAYFLPKDVVGITWVPFYTWSLAAIRFAQVFKFVYPTEKLVNEYRVKYGNHLNKTIDWNANKLLMTAPKEYLLISADRRGLFDAIPKHEIPEDALKYNHKIIVPMPVLRMKLEDPYLAIMFCNDYFATIMAIDGTGPTTHAEMKAEAEVLKFRGTGKPVWRNIEAEKELARIQKEDKLEEKRNKFMYNEVPNPKTIQEHGLFEGLK